jgi:hypothetical protein
LKCHNNRGAATNSYPIILISRYCISKNKIRQKQC